MIAAMTKIDQIRAKAEELAEAHKKGLAQFSKTGRRIEKEAEQLGSIETISGTWKAYDLIIMDEPVREKITKQNKMSKEELISALEEINKLASDLKYDPRDYSNFGKIEAISERVILSLREYKIIE